MSDEYGFSYDPNMNKTVGDINDASAYSYMAEHDRVFYRSHVYGGTHAREERKVYVFNSETKKLEKRVITTPKLQERLFLEILSNAVDNAFRSQRMGVFFPQLEITMNSDTISVMNGGVPIPVDIHPYFYSQGVFGTVAELIFGVIGAGSNMDDSKVRQGSGVNAVGAKLCNVFSRYFEVEIGDNIRGFHQKVIWGKNMKQKYSSVITPSNYATTTQPDHERKYHIYPLSDKYTGVNFTKVTWKQDFRKFGVNFYTKDELELYMKYALEASFIGKFTVTFNGIQIDARSASNYINYYPKDVIKNSFVHYEFFTPVNLFGKQLDDAIANQQIFPSVELIVLDSPNEGMHISYCNGIYNVEGGVHTDTAYRSTLDMIKDLIKTSKGYDSKIDLTKVNIGDLKKHCTVIINYKCNDPDFKGQDKEKLAKPAPKINLTSEEAAKMKKWSIVNSIYTILTGKQLKEMGGLGIKGRIKDDFNFRDANWVGTAKQGETVLILCEGNSAGSYILKWILATPERKDKYAVMLLRGKFKNVTDKDLMEIMENEEIRKLIRNMGFEFGVDYSIPANLSRLRYGYIYSMVDADSDGQHILTLVMNFLYRMFTSFFHSRRFFYVPTPVYRILTGPNGNTKYIFYNMFDYKKYIESLNGASYTAKFFKGLAAGKDTYAKEDARCSPIVYTHFDELAGQAFDVAFKKGIEYTNIRKKWIQHYRANIEMEVLHSLNSPDPRYKYINISDFINTKLVEYCLDTFSRALPSYKDGLKKSQRQVLWYLLTLYNFGHSRKTEMNIEAIALGAKAEAKYHHGDLTDTLARMASNYPGSNNVPLLAQEGQFGTREHLGNDIGASRYVETRPEPIVAKIFDKELMDLIERNVVEDKEVEPKWIPAKLPLHIINGVIGIATAYSVEIPSYHPVDIIMWILNYITDQLCFPIIPWYKGFMGGIELELVSGVQRKDKDLVLQNQEQICYFEGLTLKTSGIFQILGERDQVYTEEVNGKKEKITHRVKDILVTEIPIGIATAKYTFEMEKKCDKVDDKAEVADTPKMILQGWKDEVSLKSLKLINRTGLTNVTLIDDNAFPIAMRNIYEALKIYCDNMKDTYTLLKNTRLKNLSELIIKETKIIKLIELLRSKTVIDDDREDEDIKKQIEPHGIEFEVYSKLGRRSTSKTGYQEHIKKLEKYQSEYKIIEERHYLKEWYDDLIEMKQFFESNQEYRKFDHHQFPYIPTPIEDLIGGKIKSPFAVNQYNCQLQSI